MVGLLPDATFGQGQARMNPGDVLVIFTDGLVEAENGSTGEEMGEEAIIAVTRKYLSSSADCIFEQILTATFQHLGYGPFKDDVTLVVVKRETSES